MGKIEILRFLLTFMTIDFPFYPLASSTAAAYGIMC
jgi:hypothetical protein